MFNRSMAAAAAVLLTACGLSACSSSTDPSGTSAAATSPAASSPAAASSAEACPITISDSWVKAAKSGMTAAFGTLKNPSGATVTVSAASTPAAKTMELHEVVDKDGEMLMQPKEGGFEVPAGGSLELKPGGYHLMLMGVTDPIEAGEEVTITLTCATGGTMEFSAQAKTFTGAEEKYSGGGMDDGGMGEMSGSPSASS